MGEVVEIIIEEVIVADRVFDFHIFSSFNLINTQ